PIAGVSIEAAESLGRPASRVRIALAQPVSHRVRSERKTVVIEFDKAVADADPIAALGLDKSAAKLPAAAPVSAPAAAVSVPVSLPASMRPAPAAQQAQSPVMQTPGTTDQPGAPRNGRQFTGHPISLDFQGADLRAVLRTFSEISGLNIVIDPA